MLLSHIEDLLESDHKNLNIFDVYKALITAWINRELIKNRDLDINVLRKACIKIAIQMQKNESRSISHHEIDRLIIASPELKNIHRIEIGGRSLLNKNSNGEYRFSHYSIQEFLIAEALLRRDYKSDDLFKIIITPLVSEFLKCNSIACKPNINEYFIGLNENNSLELFSNKNISFDGSVFIDLMIYPSEQASFKNSLFYQVYFKNGFYSKLTFFNSKINSCRLNNIDLLEVVFSNSEITNVDISFSRLANCNFANTKLTNVDFMNCRISDCSFKDSDMFNVKIKGSTLFNVDFRGCVNLPLSEFLDCDGEGIYDDNVKASLEKLRIIYDK